MNDYEIKFLTYEYETALKIDPISKQRSTYPQTIFIFSTFIHFILYYFQCFISHTIHHLCTHIDHLHHVS
jgi:uncharacterized membrane protein